MAVERPGYKPNLQKNIDSTKTESRWLDIPKAGSLIVRFLPPGNSDGLIWLRTANHYRLKKPDGSGLALADLEIHGTEETGSVDYINKLVAVSKKYGSAQEKAITGADGKGNGMATSKSWYAQVLQAEKIDDGELSWTGPRLLRVPVTGSKAVNGILQAMDMMDEVPFTDPDEGEAIIMTRYNALPWYTAQRTSKKARLDDIFPEWVDKFIHDIKNEVGLKIVTYDEQREAVMRTYPNEFDWDLLQSEHGL